MNCRICHTTPATTGSGQCAACTETLTRLDREGTPAVDDLAHAKTRLIHTITTILQLATAAALIYAGWRVTVAAAEWIGTLR